MHLPNGAGRGCRRPRSPVRLRCRVRRRRGREVGDGGNEERLDPGVELGELAVEGLDPVGQRGQDALVGAVTGSGDATAAAWTPRRQEPAQRGP